MSENALVARAFKPPWGKRKVPAFVSKAGTYYGPSVIMGFQKTQIYQRFAGVSSSYSKYAKK